MATPWKHPQTGFYYLRKAIPKDIRHVFSGKTIFKKSLGTKDPKQAKMIFLSELEKVEQLISMARDGSIAFSAKQSRALAGMWLKKALGEDEQIRDTRGTPENETEHDPVVIPYEEELSQISDASNFPLKQKEVWVLNDIHSLFEDIGLISPKRDSEGYRFLVNEFLAAKYQYYSIISKRAQGEWVSIDIDSRYPVLDHPKTKQHNKKNLVGSGTYLSGILKEYRDEGLITTKTADDYNTTIRHFEKISGTIPIELITVEHIRAYRDSLVSLGGQLATATKTRKIGAIKSLLSYAIDKGLIDNNPAANIKIRSKENTKGSKLPFTSEDTQHIFTSKVFTTNYRPKAGAGEAAYWLPYLALYTGARLEELGQLRVDDIQEFDTIPFIEFTTEMDEEGSKRSIKTRAGKRIVPLHPDLIKLGFLDYVESQRKLKKTQLFHLLSQDKYGDYTQNWSKWFNQRYLREELKITDKKKTFHSFRHTFIGTCRTIGMPEDIQNAIVGHEGDKKVSLGYGRWQSPRGGTYAYDPKVLLKELKKIDIL